MEKICYLLIISYLLEESKYNHKLGIWEIHYFSVLNNQMCRNH